VGFLLNLFKKKQQLLPPADFSVLKTDLHSHLIPGIDDGAKDLDHSIKLIKGLKELGYQKIITTPHTMSDYYKNTPEIILEGLKIVRDQLNVLNIEIEIEASSEYFLDQHFMKLIEQDRLIPIAGEYILFELSFMTEPKLLGEVIFQLQLKGFKPILAHVERYTYWHQNYEKFQELKDKGVLFQLNINSLTGVYGESTKLAAEHMIEADQYEFIGSDCHHEGHIELMKKASQFPKLHQVIKSKKLLNHTL